MSCNEFKQANITASVVGELCVRKTNVQLLLSGEAIQTIRKGSAGHDEMIIALPQSSRRSLFKPQTELNLMFAIVLPYNRPESSHVAAVASLEWDLRGT